MVIFNECFNSDFFVFIISLCAAGTGCGVLLPVGAWAAGMVVSLLSKIIRLA